MSRPWWCGMVTVRGTMHRGSRTLSTRPLRWLTPSSSHTPGPTRSTRRKSNQSLEVGVLISIIPKPGMLPGMVINFENLVLLSILLCMKGHRLMLFGVAS